MSAVGEGIGMFGERTREEVASKEVSQKQNEGNKMGGEDKENEIAGREEERGFKGSEGKIECNHKVEGKESGERVRESQERGRGSERVVSVEDKGERESQEKVREHENEGRESEISLSTPTFTDSLNSFPPNKMDLQPGIYFIKSVKFDECMYANDPKLDVNRRYVLTWGKKCDLSDLSMHWEVTSFGSYYAIRNVKHQEFMYANDPTLNSLRRHVLTWVKGGHPFTDLSMRWDISFYGSYYGIRSVKFGEYLYANRPKLDQDRRRVLTWKKTGDPLSDNAMRWDFVKI